MNRAQKRILHALPLMAAIYCQPSIPRAFFNFPRRFVLSGVNSVYCHCQSRLRAKLLIQILGKLQFQTALPATRTGKKFSRCFKQIDISKLQGGTSWKYLTNLNLEQEDSHLPCSDAVFVPITTKSSREAISMIYLKWPFYKSVYRVHVFWLWK